jgi:hypothetical protein
MNVKSLTPFPSILSSWCLEALLLVSILILSTVVSAGTNQTMGVDDDLLQLSKDQKITENWGIELVAMRSTAAGHMLDFRYRVLDAVKAAPLLKQQAKPYLIHQSSGKVLSIPNTAKLGLLRTSTKNPQNGRTYWMFFGNHHKLIQKGDKVTVAIGDFRATDIEVK